MSPAFRRRQAPDWLVRVIWSLVFLALIADPVWTSATRLRPVRTVEQAKYCVGPFGRGKTFMPCAKLYADVVLPL